MKYKNRLTLAVHRAPSLALAAAVIAYSQLASATDVYWNNTSATWSTGSSTWNTASDGTGTTQVWANGDSAIFSAGSALTGSYTLTNSGVTVDNITQEEGRVRISSNTLTLADTSMSINTQTRVSGDYDLRIDSVIANSGAGASSISKSGNGLLLLTGANTFSGGFTLNAGTASIETNSGAFGSGTLTLNGGNLTKSWGATGSTNATVSNAISVTGTTNVAVVQGNAGNLIFSGAWGAGNTGAVFKVGNTNVNGLAIQSSTIVVSGDVSAYTGTFSHNNLASGGNRLRFGVNNGGNVGFNAANSKFLTSGSTTGVNVLDLADGAYGTFQMGELAGTGGRLRAGWASGGHTTFQVGALNSHSKFSGLLDDNINGAGGKSGLSKVGTGTLELGLAAGNTYTNGTTITGGKLVVSNTTGSATGTGSVNINGGTLAGTGLIAPTGTNGINVTSGTIAPGGSVTATTGGSFTETVGTLGINLANTTGAITLSAPGGFEFGLGAAGASIAAVGTSDMVALFSASANDFTFNSNAINFGGTGAEGFYKLFDTDLDSTTWAGLTFDGVSGVVTGGLTYTNLATGLTGELIVGGFSNGGSSGDIYLQVVPEPSASIIGALGALALLRRRRI
jgi:fibronectin-binding autotransporter adhesin